MCARARECVGVCANVCGVCVVEEERERWDVCVVRVSCNARVDTTIGILSRMCVVRRVCSARML